MCLQGVYAGAILGRLLSRDIIGLSLFMQSTPTPSADPSEAAAGSSFHACGRMPELIIKSLGEMVAVDGDAARAQAAYAGLPALGPLMLKALMPPPKQTAQDALNELSEKFKVPFALC